jgi:hypothetical protein
MTRKQELTNIMYSGKIADILEQKEERGSSLSSTTRAIEELRDFQRSELNGEPVLFLTLDDEDVAPTELNGMMSFRLRSSDLIHYAWVRDVVTTSSLLRGDYRIVVAAPLGVRVATEEEEPR